MKKIITAYVCAVASCFLTTWQGTALVIVALILAIAYAFEKSRMAK